MHPTAYDHGELGDHPEDVTQSVYAAALMRASYVKSFLDCTYSPGITVLIGQAQREMMCPPQFLGIGTDARANARAQYLAAYGWRL